MVKAAGNPSGARRATKAGSPRGRRAKGEQSRRNILAATFRVIAREGIRTVSHRAVAAEAAVPLSLTTYYFSDIDTMIEEAFGQFMARMRPDLDKLWSNVFAYLEGFSATELRKAAVRETVCDHLARVAARYVVAQYTRRPEGLAVEQIFFTEARLSPRLRKLARLHRQQLLVPLQQLCACFNRRDPELDAELLLDTITALEYQGLALPDTAQNRRRVLALLRRQLGWVMGVKCG